MPRRGESMGGYKKSPGGRELVEPRGGRGKLSRFAPEREKLSAVGKVVGYLGRRPYPIYLNMN